MYVTCIYEPTQQITKFAKLHTYKGPYAIVVSMSSMSDDDKPGHK